MRRFGDLSAVHLNIREQDGESLTRLQVPLPADQWHAAIIELCWQRFEYCIQIHNSAMSVYETDLERRHATDGQVLSSLPVRLSWGIVKVMDLLRDFRSTFEALTRSIDACRDHATFGNNTGYERLSRSWLRHSRDLRDRIEFSLQTSMWVQWISESLWQASELSAYLEDDDSRHLEEYGPEMFSYIAHPPLLVAVLTSAAMVEEVGAVAVKELDTGINPDLDDTKLETVIGWLRDSGLAPEEIDLDLLNDTLRKARNDLSHSMTARGTRVTLDMFDAYVETVRTAVELGLNLSHRLVTDLLSELDDLPLTQEHSSFAKTAGNL